MMMKYHEIHILITATPCKQDEINLILHPHQQSWGDGLLVSPCLSIRLSVQHGWQLQFVCRNIFLWERLSVRLWTATCPLCIFHNTRQIHFIFTHLINQLQKVCHMLSSQLRFQFLLNVFIWSLTPPTSLTLDFSSKISNSCIWMDGSQFITNSCRY